eukprot:m.19218 g.19218  ORF g.19218 m.19218 type:complete len:425 (-) comp11732_c0_seq1:638-1912(-)
MMSLLKIFVCLLFCVCLRMSEAVADVIEAEVGTLFWTRVPCATDVCSTTIRSSNGPAPAFIQTTTTPSRDATILYGTIPTAATPRDLTLMVYEQGQDSIPLTVRIMSTAPSLTSTFVWTIEVVVDNYNISQILDTDGNGNTRVLRLNEEFSTVSSTLTGMRASARVTALAYTNPHPRNVPPVLAGGVFPNWFLNRTISVQVKIVAAIDDDTEDVSSLINCSALQQQYDWSASDFVLSWSACVALVTSSEIPPEEGNVSSTPIVDVQIDGSSGLLNELDWTRTEDDFNETVLVSVIVACVVLVLGVIWITQSSQDDTHHGRETVQEHKRYMHLRNKFAFHALFPEASPSSQSTLVHGKTRRRMTTRHVVKHVAFDDHINTIPPSPARPSAASQISSGQDPAMGIPPQKPPPPYENPPGPHDESML